MSAVLTAVACAPATIGLAPLGMLIVPVYTRRRHDRAAARVAAAVCLADRSWRREQLRQVHDRQD
ncbi:MAG TPA: hypothetical protein VFQ15_01070, partial [Jiangellaceae bacterium]|nr:hypothetical protein [Jiangellaceae bacterium]